MTRTEYLDKIKELFQKHLITNESDFYDYSSYGNTRAETYLSEFFASVRELGLKFTPTHHDNGIGNNNENYIYLEDEDEEGFIIEKKIAKIFYCYGIYGRLWVYLYDVKNDEMIMRCASYR